MYQEARTRFQQLKQIEQPDGDSTTKTINVSRKAIDTKGSNKDDSTLVVGSLGALAVAAALGFLLNQEGFGSSIGEENFGGENMPYSDNSSPGEFSAPTSFQDGPPMQGTPSMPQGQNIGMDSQEGAQLTPSSGGSFGSSSTAFGSPIGSSSGFAPGTSSVSTGFSSTPKSVGSQQSAGFGKTSSIGNKQTETSMSGPGPND